MDPVTAAIVIGAGGALISTIANIGYGIWKSNEDYKHAEEATQKDIAYQEKVRDYNSTAEQKKRLENEGLNPYFYLGQPAIQSGAGVAFPAQVLPDLQPTFTNLTNQFAALPSTAANIQATQQKISESLKGMEFTDKQIANLTATTSYTKAQILELTARLPHELQLLTLQVARDQQITDSVKRQNALARDIEKWLHFDKGELPTSIVSNYNNFINNAINGAKTAAMLMK